MFENYKNPNFWNFLGVRPRFLIFWFFLAVFNVFRHNNHIESLIDAINCKNKQFGHLKMVSGNRAHFDRRILVPISGHRLQIIA